MNRYDLPHKNERCDLTARLGSINVVSVRKFCENSCIIKESDFEVQEVILIGSMCVKIYKTFEAY